MKNKLTSLLFLMPLILNCNINSPYIDVITEKINQDQSGEVSVAPAVNMSAQAVSFNSATNLGTISLSWENPVAPAEEIQPVSLILRVKDGSPPEHTSDGNELYQGNLTTDTVNLTDAVLGTAYHFGIWTQDEDGNLSDPVYTQASIENVTLNVLKDLHYETTTPFVDDDHTNLYLGNTGGGNHVIHIKFDNLPVTRVIGADLYLFTAEPGTIDDIRVSVLSEDWNGSEDANALLGKSASLYYSGIFFTSGIATWSKWDITTIAQYWEDNINEGIRIEDSSNKTAAHFRSSENSAYPPAIEIYYHSD